ncbi:hypothetical protein GCM10010404_87220 [Nonomuraea africana]|uniref:class I SAM-dependent methyltransferase n=1 Tax=Nonomuraea africana TaxID=46171 RepID=UPI003374540D
MEETLISERPEAAPQASGLSPARRSGRNLLPRRPEPALQGKPALSGAPGGTGQITPLLAGHFGAVVCVDLSADMLAQAVGAPGARVQGEASRLPLAGSSVDAAVLVDTSASPVNSIGSWSAMAWWSGSICSARTGAVCAGS